MKEKLLICAILLSIVCSTQAAVFWSESFESASLGQFTDCSANSGYWIARDDDAEWIQCDGSPNMPCDGVGWAHGDTWEWNSPSQIDIMWAGPIDLSSRSGRIEIEFCYLVDQYFGYGDELYFYANCLLPTNPCNSSQWNLLWNATGGCTTDEVTVDLTSLVGCHPGAPPDCNQVYIAFGYPGLHYRGVGIDNVRLNDGNSCVSQYDWGDAPDPTFPTLGTSNGAVHRILPGMFMGLSVDSESNGYPSSSAEGDDDALTDDEDGVVFSPGTTVMAGTAITANVTVSQPGFLHAWADSNCDGDWNDVGEQIASSMIVATGVNTVGPFTPSSGGNCYIRFRYSATSGLSYFGTSSSGEVEDYLIIVESIPIQGDDCDNPIPISFPADLPFHDELTTCTLDPEYANTCLVSYDSGEDIIYEISLSDDRCLSFTLTGDINLIGMALDTDCPPNMSCEALCTSSTSYTCSIPAISLTAGTYYLMIDNFAAPSCIPHFTLDIIDCPASPVGDNCASPAFIGCGECIYASTLGAIDDFDCNGATAGFDGPDRVYELIIDAETLVTIKGQAAFNADWAISQTCSTSAGDILCSLDAAVTSSTSCASFQSNLNSDLFYSGLLSVGVYYIWIDGFSSADIGPYSLEVECSSETPPGDQCANAIPVSLNGPQISNDNCYPYTNDWTEQSGNDVFYRLELSASSNVTMCLSADFDTYLTLLEADCSTVIARDNDTECTGLTCNGSAPIFSNSSITRILTPGVYYIVVESYSSAYCGDFCLNIFGYYVNTSTSMGINEIDIDTAGSPDTLEFVELYNGGISSQPLTNQVLVFFDGISDSSYYAIDLGSHFTDSLGYFLVGNSLVSPSPAIVFPNNTLRNTTCAVALYWGHANGFPLGSPVTTIGLIDAIVYDPGAPDDSGLLRLLWPGQPQINENETGAASSVSMMRCPDGAGGQRVTSEYYLGVPVPGGPNATCPMLRTPTPTLTPTPTVPPTVSPTPSPPPVPATGAGSISILLIALGAMLLIARRH